MNALATSPPRPPHLRVTRAHCPYSPPRFASCQPSHQLHGLGQDSIIPRNPVNRPTTTIASAAAGRPTVSAAESPLGLLIHPRVREAGDLRLQSPVTLSYQLGQYIWESQSNSDASASPPVAPKGFVPNEGQAAQFFYPCKMGCPNLLLGQAPPNGQVTGLLKDGRPATPTFTSASSTIPKLIALNRASPAHARMLIELFTGAPASSPLSKKRRQHR